jgi:hypothetical protein
MKVFQTSNHFIALTNDVLIVSELDFWNVQTFAFVQLLFVGQNVVVEEFLKLFVTIIDAKLFERVDGEILCKMVEIKFGY